MRAITKDHLEILIRRKEFLEARIKKLKSYKGDTYDKSEAEALRVALSYMTFIREHPSIQRRIKEQGSLEEIYELSKKMGEL